MKKVTIEYIQESLPYQVVQFENGRYGVRDFLRDCTMAAGMDINQAANWANRANYRHVWGV